MKVLVKASIRSGLKSGRSWVKGVTAGFTFLICACSSLALPQLAQANEVLVATCESNIKEEGISEFYVVTMGTGRADDNHLYALKYIDGFKKIDIFTVDDLKSTAVLRKGGPFDAFNVITLKAHKNLTNPQGGWVDLNYLKPDMSYGTLTMKVEMAPGTKKWVLSVNGKIVTKFYIEADPGRGVLSIRAY